MKVIILGDDETNGKEVNVKNEAIGYAQNFLIKKGLAEEATPGNLQKLKEHNDQVAEEKEQELVDAQLLKKELESKEVEIKTKSGEGGRLFGSISSKQVVEAF